jgi:hypothetical protein
VALTSSVSRSTRVQHVFQCLVAQLALSVRFRINPQLPVWSVSSNWFSPTIPAPNPHRWAVSCMLRESHSLLHRLVTNKVNNSSAKRRDPHQISQPYFDSPPSRSPTRTRTSIDSAPTDRRSERLVKKNNRRRGRTWKRRRERSPSMTFEFHCATMTTDRRDIDVM